MAVDGASISTVPSHYDPDDVISRAVSVNFSGRFKGQEVRDLGHAFVRHIVTSRSVGIVLGQQVNFRLTSLPADFELVGGQRAFVAFDRKQFRANDETQYRHFLRDLEMKGRMTKYFLPEANYALCKMKSKRLPDVAMIVMSWLTDETNDTLKSLNLLRKLLSFAANLCAIEEMPVLIGGSFRLSLDNIKQVVYNEFEGFRCYGYQTEKPKRQQRMCDVYISCPPLRLDDVKPVVSGKIEISDSSGKTSGIWRSPEDAFYWDPVFATLYRRVGASSVVSAATSPRALTPPPSTAFERHHGLPVDGGNLDSRASISGAAWTMNAMTSTTSGQPGAVFDSAEETLRVLLLESDRIKEMVSEAESRARSWLQTKSTLPDDGESDADDGSQIGNEENVNGVGLGDRSEAEDEETKTTREAILGAKAVQQEFELELDDADDNGREVEEKVDKENGQDDWDGDTSERNRTGLRFRSRTGGCRDDWDGAKGEKNCQTTLLSESALALPRGGLALRKVPSYVDLYDEELIDTNMRCYMQ